MKVNFKSIIMLVLIVLAVILAVSFFSNNMNKSKDLSYGEVIEKFEKDDVISFEIDGDLKLILNARKEKAGARRSERHYCRDNSQGYIKLLCVTNLDSCNSYLTVCCITAIANTKCDGFSVYSNYCVRCHLSLSIEKNSVLVGRVGDLYRCNGLSCCRYGDRRIFVLVNSPRCVACVVFTGILSVRTNSTGGNRNGNIGTYVKAAVKCTV